MTNRGFSATHGSTFLVSDKMLDNYVSHIVSVCIAIFVKSMDSTEDQLVVGNSAILAANSLKGRGK